MHPKPPIIAAVWIDGAYRPIRQGEEIPPEEGYLDLQDDMAPLSDHSPMTGEELERWERLWWIEKQGEPMTEQERAEWARLKRIAGQEPIEIEKHEPVPGQRELFNEPGPEEFKLSGQPKSKRRKR